jgi:hypothetical protein
MEGVMSESKPYHDLDRKKIHWLIRLLVFLTCWPAAVLAGEPTYSVSSEHGKLTLTAEPCKAHEWLNGWQLARWTWQGKYYEGCWRIQSDGRQKLVVVLDSAGEVTTFYPAQFIKDEAL